MQAHQWPTGKRPLPADDASRSCSAKSSTVQTNEPDALAVMFDGLDADGRGEMRLARAWAADQDNVVGRPPETHSEGADGQAPR